MESAIKRDEGVLPSYDCLVRLVQNRQKTTNSQIVWLLRMIVYFGAS